MARKEIEITIEEGRDAGKTFKITEMPATQANIWMMKMLGILGKAGIQISSLNHLDMMEVINVISAAGYEQAEPLLSELLECASFKKDGALVSLKSQNIIDSVIEDWITISRLQMESLRLNLGFLVEEEGSESG